MSFVITVCNLVQMLYTLASLKMILRFGHCVCDIHKVGKKCLPTFILHRFLSVAEAAIANAHGD